MTQGRPLAPFRPNRPDALGALSGSRIADDPSSPYSQSRYAAAVRRLVDRLLTKANIEKGESTRGKRRLRDRPQDQSNSVRTYLKALEIFSYYCIGQFGRELEPREVTTDAAMAFANWMAGEGPGPDVRSMFVRALGADHAAVYEALGKACKIYGQASIVHVYEQLPATVRSRLVSISADPRVQNDWEALHKILGRLVRAFRTILRSPTSKEIRQQTGIVWGQQEKNFFVYRYALAPRQALATASVRTHLGALSAVWTEMTKPTSPDDIPISFNPWRGVYAEWTWRMRRESENARVRGERKSMTTPMVKAMLNACRGVDLWDRRDFFALNLLIFKGLRAEELAGILRKDLVDEAGMLAINVLGKGNKVRRILLDAMERDALMLLTGKIEEHAKNDGYTDEAGNWILSYHGAYCQALLEPDAPLVPALWKWGCNRSDLERPTRSYALEPFDTSGIRAMIARIADKARVKVLTTGEIRGFNSKERELIHPHAFRHYCATAAKEGGVDITTVQALLGHSSLATTGSYIAVPVQVSAAVGAAVYKTLYDQGPLTAEELANLRATSVSALADYTIVEWEPEAVRKPPSAMAAPLTEQQRRMTIASPTWAYGEEKPDTMMAYLSGRVTARAFSTDVKKRVMEADQAVQLARVTGDARAYATSVQNLATARARHLWITFRIGRMTHLPWWAGRANRWKGTELAPILSYAQVAPENSADGALLSELTSLYDDLVAKHGPTAGTAMVAWLGELIDIAGMQFAAAMNERGDVWIPFDAEASAQSPVVREHMTEAIVAWLEQYGWAVHATGYKNAKNRGNIAIAAMDSLPDWFWVEDPLADPQLGIPRSERAELRSWVTGLQSTRPSRVRLEQWLDQMAIRIVAWAKSAKAYGDRSGRPWQWASEYRDEESFLLAGEALSIAEDFVIKYPGEFKKMDVAAFVRELPLPYTEGDTRKMLVKLLEVQQAENTGVLDMRLDPTMPSRAGAAHMFDPMLLSFDERDTIVHDERTRKWWYEQHGTDSECVTRRALRVLWERRKRSARSQSHGLIIRHFDLELSSIIPCARAIEERISVQGWTPPSNVAERLRISKVMWAGMLDYIRVSQGIDPVEQVPPSVIEAFWSYELPDLVKLAEEQSRDVVTIRDDEAQVEQVLGEVAAELDAADPLFTTPAEVGSSARVSPPLSPDAAPLPPLDDASVEYLVSAQAEQEFRSLQDMEEFQSLLQDEKRAEESKRAAQEVERLFEAADQPGEAQELSESEEDEAIRQLSELSQEASQDTQIPRKAARKARPGEASIDDFDLDRAQARGQRGARIREARAARASEAQITADELARIMRPIGSDLFSIDASIFWRLIMSTPAKWIVFSSAPGDAAAFSRKALRAARPILVRLKATVMWDADKRTLRFRWREGKGGLNLYSTAALPAADDFVAIAMWKKGDATPNARPRWSDPRPWAPQWPGYPMPSKLDADDPFVQTLPWPKNPVEDAYDAALFHSCMMQYEGWKRRTLRPNAKLPPGWRSGTQGASPVKPGLPHPIHFAFSIVRGA